MSDNTVRTKFLIVCAPRTGSNLLQTMLNSHPEIICHSELFNKDGIYYGGKQGKEFKSALSLQQRQENPIAFAGMYYNLGVSGGPYSAIGFKMLNGQNDRVLNVLINDPEIKKVILKRENLLQNYLSFLEMEKTGKVNASSLSETHISGCGLTIKIDWKYLNEYISKISGFYSATENRLNETGQSYFFIRYTDLYNSRVIRDLISFLQVSDMDFQLKSDLLKLNQRALSERIENFDEICSRLKEKGLGHYLNEE